jgi:hypothetical protein
MSTKEAFPPISNEIRSAPKPKLNVALKPRVVPVEAIADGVRVIGEKWGSSTQVLAEQPASKSVQDREKWPSVRFECPPYLDRELSLKAAGEGVTKTYLILKALAEAGFTLQDQDLNKDKRKYRR